MTKGDQVSGDIEGARERLERLAEFTEGMAHMLRGTAQGDEHEASAKAYRAFLADHSRLLERVGELEREVEAASSQSILFHGIAERAGRRIKELEGASRNTGNHLCGEQPVINHDATAALASGWVLVPREPTEAMTRAWWRSHFSDDPVPGGRSDRDAYAAMLAAAPTPKE